VSTINRRAGSGDFTHLDPESETLLEIADQLWRSSGGLFDITSGVLRKAWRFDAANTPVDLSQLEALKKKVGWDKVKRTGEGVYLPVKGMEIDLGGLAKEYAADCAVRLLRDHGVTSALIELAGDVATIGSQPSGRPWRVGIRAPQGGDPVGGIALSNAAAATSGNYARTLQFEGRTYGHLLNPLTGWPVEGPTSVTVIGENCLSAGAVTTIACLQSPKGAMAWLSEAGLPWLMIGQDAGYSGPLASKLGLSPP
jgi:thiamine biosynthesis lipoprotein